MLVAECEKRQLACGMPYVRSEMTKLLSRSNEYKATTDTRLKEIEKQLDQGRNDFISVMGDLSQIRQTLASMPTALSFSTVKTDISEIKESIARVQTVIEYSLQHTEHHD